MVQFLHKQFSVTVRSVQIRARTVFLYSFYLNFTCKNCPKNCTLPLEDILFRFSIFHVSTPNRLELAKNEIQLMVSDRFRWFSRRRFYHNQKAISDKCQPSPHSSLLLPSGNSMSTTINSFFL